MLSRGSFGIRTHLLRRKVPSCNCQIARGSHPKALLTSGLTRTKVGPNPVCGGVGGNRGVRLRGKDVLRTGGFLNPTRGNEVVAILKSAEVYSTTVRLTTRTSLLVRRTAFSRKRRGLTRSCFRSAAQRTTGITHRTGTEGLYLGRVDSQCRHRS